MSLAHRNQPNLESLDDRLLPSATVLDLTTRGAVATAPSGAIVEQIDPQPMGSGFIHAFVRIQGAASGGGTEQGYNTDGRPLQFDENNSPQFTRSLILDQVPIVIVNGVAYREFLLDINQKSSSPLLSLDQVQMFLGASGNLTGYDPSTKTLAGMAPVFDLNSGGNVSVKLDARLTSGIGSGDMALLVPNDSFAGASGSQYVYLYSMFGAQPGETANGGFEQWAVPSTPPNQSPAAVGSLSGAVFVYGTNTPLARVTITLNGTDSQGNTVVLTTTTDANGAYTFANLAAGTYTITQTPPTGYTEVAQVLGTVNGVLTGTSNEPDDQFTNVTLGAGQNGSGYVFYDSFAGLPS